MDSQTAFSWVTVGAVALASLLGAVMVATVSRSYWKTLSIAASPVAFALIGAGLLLAPKWTEFVFEYGDMKIQIAKLEETQRQNAILISERDGLLNQVADLNAEKAIVRSAVAKAVEAAAVAKTQPFDPSKWDGAATQLNNALDLWK